MHLYLYVLFCIAYIIYLDKKLILQYLELSIVIFYGGVY